LRILISRSGLVGAGCREGKLYFRQNGFGGRVGRFMGRGSDGFDRKRLMILLRLGPGKRPFRLSVTWRIFAGRMSLVRRGKVPSNRL
jgi:hypothetical protein